MGESTVLYDPDVVVVQSRERDEAKTKIPSEGKTLIDYFEENVTKFGRKRFMTQPMGGGKVRCFTFQNILDEARKMAGYLEEQNLPPNSHIAICSKNCAWWVIADLAIWISGHVSIPIYPTLTAETTKFILEHSEAKLLFIGKLDQEPWKEMKGGIPDTLATISFPLCPRGKPAHMTWKEATKASSSIKVPVKRSPSDMATIIYTSGSTGKPKGVMTSFYAMTTSAKGLMRMINPTEKDRYLSYLPVSHSFERWLGECVPMISATEIFYAESLKTFVADLNRCRPTLFLSVPRLWTKFQAGVFAKLPQQKLELLLKVPIVSTLVKKKVLKTLGLDQVRFAGSGSAPLSKDLLEWYRSLGLELLEGYGMSENFNYSHVSKPGKVRTGYVGNTYDDVDCRIAKDGEIQVKTPGQMMGYFKDEKATNESLTEDGWLRTGDKGRLDKQGRLKITGRTKEIFKTSKGKYVAPAPIENLFVGSRLVELACVSGRAYPQPHAIIQLSEGPKADAEKGLKEMDAIARELLDHMKTVVNPQVDPHERIDFCVIVKDDWLPENGFLTPTQKIKRPMIEGTYGSNVDGWYNKKNKVIWHGW